MSGVSLKERCCLGRFMRLLPSGLPRRVVSVLGAVSVLGGGTAVAGSAERPLVEPPRLNNDGKDGREIRFPLTVKETPGKIFNPRTGRDDAVILRSYEDHVDDRFVAPTIEMEPGQTVRITLKNELPAEQVGSGCKSPNDSECFHLNSTNLHTHGLWISPSGNSDNVLLSINPRATPDSKPVSFQYEYNVPQDHPAGTFWYHPHKHGSTALQVSSGMAGALIIKGNRPPKFDDKGELKTPGDIDTLLEKVEPKPVAGKKDAEVILFQQIPYACSDANGNILEDEGRWDCKAASDAKLESERVGRVKDFDKQIKLPGVWAKSGRYTLLNGIAQPTARLEAGRVYRWRLIHAGVNETIKLRIAKVVPAAKAKARPLKMTPEAENTYIEGNCSKESADQIAQWEIAADGLTRDTLLKKDINYLHPGYRSDVLLVFPTEGSYCVYDDSSKSEESVSASDENARLLAWVEVAGGTPLKPVDVRNALIKKLVKAAGNMSGELSDGAKTKIKKDLSDLKLSSFVWHSPVTDDELKDGFGNKREQSLFFNINSNSVFFVGDKTSSVPGYNKEGRPFSGKDCQSCTDDECKETCQPVRVLTLGTAEEWVLTSKVAGHPFHIHVNPFQVVSIKIKDKGGDGYREINENDYKAHPEYVQYVGMIGTWKDTIFITTATNVEEQVEIRVRTRYERYIGDFVLHCHILKHEDLGMMQNVRIVLPDGKGGVMVSGHQH